MLHRQGQPGEDSHEDVQVSGVLRVLPATTPRRRERQKKESDERRASRSGMKQPETLCTRERCEAHTR